VAVSNIAVPCIEPYLAEVNKLFEHELRSGLPQVQQLVSHVGKFRGKMLRPSLVLLSGLAAQNIPGELDRTPIVLAAVVEMVHVATLVHDDVLDGAVMRRRGATINHLHGNEAAVLLGDLLISHAFHLCSSLESQSASRLIGQTTNIVCEGELTQNFNRGNWELDEETYLDIIYRKTASLIETSCRLGAAAVSHDKRIIDALALYGRRVGMAFQITDDVLDIAGQQKTVGKSLGSDIDKGKLTLPMIHFLATAAPTHRELLMSLLESTETDRVEHVRQLLIPSPSMTYARRQAALMVSEAIASLNVLPESEAKHILTDMAQFITVRQS
jgi:octaprenyl-diphosphate synthase